MINTTEHTIEVLNVLVREFLNSIEKAPISPAKTAEKTQQNKKESRKETTPSSMDLKMVDSGLAKIDLLNTQKPKANIIHLHAGVKRTWFLAIFLVSIAICCGKLRS